MRANVVFGKHIIYACITFCLWSTSSGLVCSIHGSHIATRYARVLRFPSSRWWLLGASSGAGALFSSPHGRGLSTLGSQRNKYLYRCSRKRPPVVTLSLADFDFRDYIYTRSSRVLYMYEGREREREKRFSHLRAREVLAAGCAQMVNIAKGGVYYSGETRVNRSFLIERRCVSYGCLGVFWLERVSFLHNLWSPGAA